ncbi:IspD/TarI family cytidylyltransferase [Pseudochrobactrum sp. MP213Fo]|uniref:IspD/TarI family cytidylyltransferase n=1 Tax=Pseudochrobactrum sp. MP213Fo TaxID=3022250 RepID=UPI003BA04509
MNFAVITAAGVGSRMNNQIPKQFLTVNDKPIVIHTIEAIHRNPNIDQILVACLGGWEKMLQSYVKEHGLNKVKWIIEGGETGQETITKSLETIRKVASPTDLIMIHDGNRPFVEEHIINESIRVCKQHGNAVAAIPCTEAILQLEEVGSDIPQSRLSIDRDQLVRTQTPHTFPFAVLDQAYQEIKAIDDSAVAACTVMVALGKDVFFSPGSELNFKITTQDDLKMFSLLVKAGIKDGV